MSLPLIRPSRRRGRAGISLTAAAGLIGATAFAAATPAPAQSAAPALADPVADCAEPFPVADIVDGATVNGLTVSEGTTPDPFTGKVLGVLESGIAPDLDMIIMELDSPAIAAAGGIWQGMSGSPVYDDASDDLIGAVAYGMSWGPSPIAGITPFEDMDDYLAAGAPKPGKVEVGKAMAHKIAANSDLTAAQAEQGLRQLKMPFGVSGLSPSRLAEASHELRRYLPKSTYVSGRAAPGMAGPETVIAGGNLAASLSHGYINQAGVGTATSVCDGRVVGFGHPMTFAGETTMSLHPADAIYVQPDSLGSPFKVANLGDAAGLIDEDHLAGITGTFGATSDATTISSSFTYKSTTRSGSTEVTVADATPGTTFYQVLANHDRVVDAIRKGSEDQSWTIAGIGPDGQPFSLSSSDRYVSNYDISFDASFELSDIVYLLGSVPDLSIESVNVTGTVSDDTSRFQVKGLEQHRKGEWNRVSRRNPATVKGGKTLKLRAVLTATDGGVVRVPFDFKVSKRLAGAKGFVYLTGGNDYFSEDFFYEFYEGGSTSLDDVEKLLAGQLRNDEILARLNFFGGGEDGECRGCRGPGGSVAKEKVLGPVSKVVSGFKLIKVVVKG